MSELEQYTQGVAHHYDEEAKTYDDIYTHPIQLAEDKVLMEILKPFVASGQTMLDIGCGTGLPLTYLTIPGYHGLDISPGMIAQAKKDHPDNEFQVGDMHHLPFPDNSMDTVISLFGPFSYSLDPKQVVAEIYRVLKPGGTALIMPYTQRVGYGLDMGGYSTANTSDVEKNFYDTESLHTLFGSFSQVDVFGINYFGNTLAQYDEVMKGGLTQTDYQNFLSFEVSHAQEMPDIKYARHSMVIAQKQQVGYRRKGK